MTSTTHKMMIQQLSERPESEPFALLNKNYDEFARAIKFRGQLRIFGKDFGDAMRSYTDFPLHEYPNLLKKHNIQNSRTLKHLYSPDVNKKFVYLLVWATGSNVKSIKSLLQNYEDYYAFTQTTRKEIIKHKIEHIGPSTANKIEAIMEIARGEF